MTGQITSDPTTPPQFLTLADKLNGLELGAEEEQALGELLRTKCEVAADASDVEGFGWDDGVAANCIVVQMSIRGFNIGMPPAIVMSGGSTMLQGANPRMDAGNSQRLSLARSLAGLRNRGQNWPSA